ncbi:leucine-rich repeat-containing protein 24-like [Ornithodoros turicata]|uniref:leucine-rich repeat-containing protein 24-like n=1 Tax=Ornithodoros turicata TaxID=34597 RepID=UPI003139BB2A
MDHLLKTFLVLVSLLSSARASSCPQACVCKWKGGKQTAECVSKGLFSVPAGLPPGIQVIDLEKNNFHSLPSRTFQERGLVNLQRIFLSECNLGRIAAEAFHQLTNLIELDISRNLLTSVPTSALHGVPHLRKLQLSGNPIAALENGSFAGLRHLTYLHLSNCQLTTIELGALDGLDALEFLMLDGNRLATLRAESVSVLPRLSTLYLNGNPWRCDCRLSSLRRWMEARNIPLSVPPRCAEPDRLEELSWEGLPLEEFACMPEIALTADIFVNVEEGRNATLTCRIHAQPAAIIRWEAAGWSSYNWTGPEPERFRVHQDQNGPFQISSLFISAVGMDDSGLFVCSAENRAGLSSTNFTLTVFRPPAAVASGLSKTQKVGIVLGSFMVVVILGVLLCLVIVRQRAIAAAAASDTKVPSGVNFLKQLTVKKAEVVEVTTPTKATEFSEKPPPPRHENGSSGYASDQQHTPDLVSKSTGISGYRLAPLEPDVYGGIGNGYANPADSSYRRYGPCDLSDYALGPLPEETYSNGSTAQLPWREDPYYSDQSSPTHQMGSSSGVPQHSAQQPKRSLPHHAVHLPVEARYSPDEGYAEGNYEGTEV